MPTAIQRKNHPEAVHLADYKLPSHTITKVELFFDLDADKTIVHSKLYSKKLRDESLILNGKDLVLKSLKMNGLSVPKDRYTLSADTLTIHETPAHFTLEIENEISPKMNTALAGLYRSGDILCTQNEPEGFRCITYFLDRPDVMATYRVHLTADKKNYPILLSNGNLVSQGNLAGNRHFALWEDPFPKPSYLFALVAGDLGRIADTFVTTSGREIELFLYCDKGNENKCYHALASLKRAMLWDEETFGLEYDLDRFMIVAVDAFNFGAMENKGLNIFNASCVLADSETATDESFQRIESIVAHEYFHNWTGNRVTCRDWFQLTLKEGLTVYRDQEFSADMHSRPVKRIEDVRHLRLAQFPEDSGPTAHPIKPASYIQIDNFYTPTIYNKGAEVIRMIETLIGKKTFRRGIDTYFSLYDGKAVTTEDFIYAMEEASGRDFTQFKRWYSQAGTPEVSARWVYKENEFHLTLSQTCKPTADKSPKEPLHFPFAVALVGKNGEDLSFEIEGAQKEGKTAILELFETSKTFVFKDVKEEPIPSLNRSFSSPVKVLTHFTIEQALHLMAHDSDSFNRWDMAQKLAVDLMLGQVDEGPIEVPDSFLQAFERLLLDESIDEQFKSEALRLPAESAIAQQMEIIDFDRIHQVREAWIEAIAKKHEQIFYTLYERHHETGPYEITSEAMGRRAIKNLSLFYLSRLETKKALKLCCKQFTEAQNMTDEFAALAFLVNTECYQGSEALQAFYEKWKENTLVMNKWLSVQAASRIPGALGRVQKLRENPVFSLKVPNLVRSLYGSFCQNHVQFHDKSGSGYKVVADVVIELDSINPIMAASIAGAFRKYPKVDEERKDLMRRQMERILAMKDLSSNTYEIISKSLL